MTNPPAPTSNRPVTRRQAVTLGGAAGAALLLGRLGGGSAGALDPFAAAPESAQAQTPSCVLSPAKTEGPYFVDEKLNRSDVREFRAGMKLTLDLVVVNVGSDCAPVSGAVVDIWHADAGGTYSDVAQNVHLAARLRPGHRERRVCVGRLRRARRAEHVERERRHLRSARA